MARYTNEMAERRKVLLPPDELGALLEAAHRGVIDLCNGTRRWTIHIPPEHDDQDLLLADALRQARLLLAEVECLRDRVAELEQLKDPDVDWIRTMNRHVGVASSQIERLRAEVADKDRIIEDLEYQVQALTQVGEG